MEPLVLSPLPKAAGAGYLLISLGTARSVQAVEQIFFAASYGLLALKKMDRCAQVHKHVPEW